MPIGGAVSTDVSGSIRTAPHNQSPHRSVDNRHISHNDHHPGPDSHLTQETPSNTHLNSGSIREGVATRSITSNSETETRVREPQLRFELALLPRLTRDAIAANSFCYILHPDRGDTIVAEGRTGGSWKSPNHKFGSLCAEGEQMVQIHKIIIPIDDRQPFTLLDHALVKPLGSSVYIKWHSRLIHRKNKPSPPKKSV